MGFIRVECNYSYVFLVKCNQRYYLHTGSHAGSYDSVIGKSTQASLSFPMIIALASLVLIITLILIDVTCYRMKKTGN